MHRVVLVSHTYIPAATRGKLRALAARGLDVTVGVPQHWREAGLGRTLEIGWERQNGVEVFPIPARYHGSVDTLRFAGRALLALLRDKRPDLIQVEEEPTSRAARQVVRLAPDLPVAVVPQLGVHVPTVPEHVHHEGLAIGCVGRLVPEKGFDTLLQALAEIRAVRWHLTLVGDGPDRERLERLATELRLAARVRWTGALPPDAVPKVWPGLDVPVLPSRALPTWAEPAAHVLAEAMAHEVAVVGTSAGATPEVIGDAGLVVPPDDPAALAAVLRQLAAPAARRPYAQAGRARAMKLFSDDAVAERTVTFWKEIVT